MNPSDIIGRIEVTIDKHSYDDPMEAFRNGRFSAFDASGYE
jgi:hypothetical protein